MDSLLEPGKPVLVHVGRQVPFVSPALILTTAMEHDVTQFRLQELCVGGIDGEWMFVGGILLVLAGLAAFVSRPVQRYRGSFHIDAPVAAVWDLIDIRPIEPIWLPGVKAIEWLDHQRREIRMVYGNDAEQVIRLMADNPPLFQEAVMSVRHRSGGSFGDVITARSVLREDGTGTWVEIDYRIERRLPGTALIHRLAYPLIVWSVARVIRLEVERRRAEGLWPRPASAPTVKRAGPLLWQAALVGASLLWFAWIFGPISGAALTISLIAHEYGHVWSMRRHGHRLARFYLVPFLGGIAIGNRPFRSDAEAAEVMLMGPVFGYAASLLCFGLALALDSPALAAATVWCVFLNAFNLLPIPPLDGGRVTQALLRPLGDKAWFALSGSLILAGAGLAAWLESIVLMLLAVLTAWGWSAAPRPDPGSRPLGRGAVALVVLLYGALVALHVGVIFAIPELFDWDEVSDLLL